MIVIWDNIINKEKNKDYFSKLEKEVKKLYELEKVYPKEADIYNAFKLTDYQNIKVVILGQDPYHGPNQAHGLAFSSLDTKTPASLRNIKKELKSDLNIDITDNNDLTNWAKQGVFLLNTILTVSQGKPLSHKKLGWEEFTLNIFKKICEIDRPIVFILWGNNARSFASYITNPKHLIIESVHPSPLSANRGFFGSKPFSKTNIYLNEHNIIPIDFSI